MPDNVYSMAYTGDTPWHKKGNRLVPGADRETWARDAGYNWTVESSPIYYRDGDNAQVSKRHRVFYRSDRPDIVLGVASNQFKPVQPRELLDFYFQFSQETELEVETAGVLGDGQRLWVLAKNKARYNVGTEASPDVIENYLLGATANDGSMGTRFKGTGIRVVCANTADAALKSGQKGLTINHRSRVDWDQVRKWVKGENDEFMLFGNLMSAFKSVDVDNDQAADFAKTLIAPEWDGKGKAPRKLRNFVTTLNSGVGQREAGPNAFGLFNAVTRYVDHDKQARSDDTRLDQAWFGAGATLKNAAMGLLIQNCVEKWGARSALQPVLTEIDHELA